MSDADNGAFRLAAGEGRRIWAFGDLMILRLTAEHTSGGPKPRWTPQHVRTP